MTRSSWTCRLLLAWALGCALAGCGNEAPAADAATLTLDSADAMLDRGQDTAAVSAFDRAIRLNPRLAGAFRGRGVAHRNLGHLDLAVRDYDSAIALDSTIAGTWNSRGFALQLMQEHERSVRDFDRALALDPAYAQALKSRGRSHFYLGHFGAAAADLGEGLKWDSANLYLPIWIHMAASRAGDSDTVRLAAQVAALDLSPWPGPVAKFYLGRISAAELAAAAASSDSAVQADQRCAVAFHLAEYLLWQPAAPLDSARRHLEEAVATCPHRFSEYLGAKADLERLQDRASAR